MSATTVLRDLSNTPHIKKKRCSNGSVKVYSSDRKIRKTMDISFCTNEEKSLFDSKLSRAKDKLGCKTNEELFSHLLDTTLSDNNGNYSPRHRNTSVINTTPDNFICSKEKLYDLVHILSTAPCDIINYEQSGHVSVITLKEQNWPMLHQWSSSSYLKDDFKINYLMVHSFLCAGIRAVQYENFCDFSNIGLVSEYFRKKMFNVYSRAVDNLKRDSISAALDVERNSSGASGLCITTDARHACRKNSYHTDVVALGYETHRVVHYEHITKQQERSSQKHEAFGTRKMYESFDQRGIQVGIHAHDRNTSVSTIVAENNVTDALDTWHASKEVIKSMKKITGGAAKWHGIRWHDELADKGAAVKTHSFWAMLNCQGNADRIRQSLDSIVPHYQGNHHNCPATSRCQQPNYIPSRRPITQPAAAALLTQTIHSLFLYKHPEKYVNCMSTHYVESFNNIVLMYIDKRVHFRTEMYDVRMGLAILDWNEHVDRPATSISQHMHVGNMNNRQGKRVLGKKTNRFVGEVWQAFVELLLHRGDEQGDVQVDGDMELEDSDVEDHDNSMFDN